MVFCGDDVATGVKDAFIYCYRCKGRKVTVSDHEDNDDNKPIGDFDYDHEVTRKLIPLPFEFHFCSLLYLLVVTCSTTRVTRPFVL